MGEGSERWPSETLAGEMLPGERVLWTGRPGRARVSIADAGFSAFLLPALAVWAVFGIAQLRGPSVFFKAVTVMVLAAAVIQVAAMLIYLLAVKPRLSQRTVYQVTAYRVVVTTGLRTRRSWSAYLDQIGEPVVKRRRDGTEDLVLRAGGKSRMGQGVDATFWSGPFSAMGEVEVPVLRSVADGVLAQQVAVAAGRRMLDGLAEVVTPPAGMSTGPLPAGVVVAAGERVLWAGRPGRVPWWFGPQDIYVSAIALVWLAFVGLMGAFAVTIGSGTFSDLPGAVRRRGRPVPRGRAPHPPAGPDQPVRLRAHRPEAHRVLAARPHAGYRPGPARGAATPGHPRAGDLHRPGGLEQARALSGLEAPALAGRDDQPSRPDGHRRCPGRARADRRRAARVACGSPRRIASAADGGEGPGLASAITAKTRRTPARRTDHPVRTRLRPTGPMTGSLS
jgi:hypothetical protein